MRVCSWQTFEDYAPQIKDFSCLRGGFRVTITLEHGIGHKEGSEDDGPDQET